ncbi:MAG: hypothetical protein Q7U47_03675 [Paludibacter sp.]|nr:hypothetical protein [Paludibacter sp.]
MFYYYNRYGYAFGNPFKYTDPSGYKFRLIDFAVLLLDAVVFTVSAAIVVGGFLIAGPVGALIGVGIDVGLWYLYFNWKNTWYKPDIQL